MVWPKTQPQVWPKTQQYSPTVFNSESDLNYITESVQQKKYAELTYKSDFGLNPNSWSETQTTTVFTHKSAATQNDIKNHQACNWFGLI